VCHGAGLGGAIQPPVGQNALMRPSSTAAAAAAVSLLCAFLVPSPTLIAVFCVFTLFCLVAWFVLERRGS
jgi:hypothetical protein